MSDHKALMNRVAERSTAGARGADGSAAPAVPGGAFIAGSDSDRALFVSFLLHCADLCKCVAGLLLAAGFIRVLLPSQHTHPHTSRMFVSLAHPRSPTFPPAVSQRIAADLSLEFEAQAQKETALGLPVTVMLAASAADKAKLELGFISACF